MIPRGYFCRKLRPSQSTKSDSYQKCQTNENNCVSFYGPMKLQCISFICVDQMFGYFYGYLNQPLHESNSQDICE